MSSKEYYKTEEVVARLSNLTDDEYVHLVRIARRRWNQNGLQYSLNTSPDDLLQEALKRTLQGRQQWKRNVRLETHFWVSMRQIAGKWAKKGKRATEGKVILREQQDEKEDIMLDGNPVCEEILEQEVVEFAKELFSGDGLAWEVMQARLQGSPKRDIIKAMSISEKEYSTIRKRITRKLKKQQSGECHEIR